MALSGISLPEVRLCGTLFNVDFCVVLTFELGTDDPSDVISVENFLDAFELAWLDDGLLNRQTTDLTWNAIEMKDLRDVNEFAVRSISVTGNSAGDPLPPFVAMGFKKDISSRVTRPGSTRIPGLTETDMSDGEWDIEPVVQAWAEGARCFTWSNGGGYTGQACLVVIGTAPDGDYDLNRVNPVTAFRAVRATTQNSRKS